MSEELVWKTEQRKIKELVPLERNPFGKINREKRKRLENKIKRLGVFEIPTIDLNNDLLTFNKRAHILMALGRGEEMIDVRVPIRQLTSDERKEVILASNVHEGEWDGVILNEDFSDLNLEEIGLDLEGLDLDVQEAASADEPLPQDKDSVSTDVVQGDLFEFIGDGCHHRLLCGDSKSSEDFTKLMNGVKAQLCVTDPPYGVSYEKKTNEILGNSREKSTVLNDDITKEELEEIIKGAFKNIHDCLDDCSAYYIFSPQGGELGLMMMMMMMMMQIPCRHVLIWVKNCAVFSMGRLDYDYQHEPILYGWKQSGTHIFYGEDKKSVLNFNKPQKSELHPTMKPVELVKELISNNSLKGELVVDAFGGSGTTMVASHELRRNAYLMELDRKYCHVIAKRMFTLFPTITVLLNGSPYQPQE